MITIVDYFNSKNYTKELVGMLEGRSEVFTDRLGWVPSMNGKETDQFDTYLARPTYIISTDDESNYEGSLRVMPTDGPNMLADVFPYIVKPDQIPHSEDILEISRIHMLKKEGIQRRRGFNQSFGELMAFLEVYGLYYGYKGMVTVMDAKMLQVIRLCGAKPELLSEEGYLQEDGIKCFVGSFGKGSLEGVKKLFKLNGEEIKVRGLDEGCGLYDQNKDINVSKILEDGLVFRW